MRVKRLLKRSPTNHIHERLFAASARFAAPCASHAKRQERETAPSAEGLSCLLVEQSGGRSMRYELVNVRPDQTPAARRRTQNGPFRLETSHSPNPLAIRHVSKRKGPFCVPKCATRLRVGCLVFRISVCGRFNVASPVRTDNRELFSQVNKLNTLALVDT